MKPLLFLTGCLLGTILTNYFQKEVTYYPMEISKEACFVIEMVENDSLLNAYLISPTSRVRTRQAVREFEKKYPRD